MNGYLLFALASSLAAIVYGIYLSSWVSRQPAGNDKMKSIAAALLFGASYIVAAESAAAAERPGEDTEAGSAVIRPAAPRNGNVGGARR